MHSKPVRLEAQSNKIDDCGALVEFKEVEEADSIDGDWLLLLVLSSSVDEYRDKAMVVFKFLEGVRFLEREECRAKNVCSESHGT
jgi:hypothetical protein